MRALILSLVIVSLVVVPLLHASTAELVMTSATIQSKTRVPAGIEFLVTGGAATELVFCPQDALPPPGGPLWRTCSEVIQAGDVLDFRASRGPGLSNRSTVTQLTIFD